MNRQVKEFAYGELLECPMKMKSIIFLLFLCFNTLHSSEWIAEFRGGIFIQIQKKFEKFIRIDLSQNFLIDLFVDYYYQEIHFYRKHNADVGGFKMGMELGLGYRF